MRKCYKLAVDIGGTKIQACLYSRLDGSSMEPYRAIKYRTSDIDFKGKNSLGNLLKRIDADLKLSKCKLDKVGLSVNCAILEGVILESSLLGEDYKGFDLFRMLRDIYPGVSYAVENDVHAMAIAEARYGAGIDCNSFLLVNLGTGIRLVPVTMGAIYRGYTNQAGEISPLQFYSDFLQDWIASDQYSAGRAIPLITAKQGGEELSAESFFTDDKLNGNLLQIYIKQLERVLWTASLFYNPEKIVFAGSLTKSSHYWLPILQKLYDSRPYSFLKANDLCVSQLTYPACLGVIV